MRNSDTTHVVALKAMNTDELLNAINDKTKNYESWVSDDFNNYIGIDDHDILHEWIDLLIIDYNRMLNSLKTIHNMIKEHNND